MDDEVKIKIIESKNKKKIDPYIINPNISEYNSRTQSLI